MSWGNGYFILTNGKCQEENLYYGWNPAQQVEEPHFDGILQLHFQNEGNNGLNTPISVVICVPSQFRMLYQHNSLKQRQQLKWNAMKQVSKNDCEIKSEYKVDQG